MLSNNGLAEWVYLAEGMLYVLPYHFRRERETADARK